MTGRALLVPRRGASQLPLPRKAVSRRKLHQSPVNRSGSVSTLMCMLSSASHVDPPDMASEASALLCVYLVSCMDERYGGNMYGKGQCLRAIPHIAHTCYRVLPKAACWQTPSLLQLHLFSAGLPQ